MSVKVYNLSQIEDLPKKTEVDVSNISIFEMIDHLDHAYGQAIGKEALIDGILKEDIKMSINGVAVSDPATLIPDGSQLIFFSVVMGG